VSAPPPVLIILEVLDVTIFGGEYEPVRLEDKAVGLYNSISSDWAKNSGSLGEDSRIILTGILKK
jgi:hypothetical protein